jgi:hypothetical protein
MAGIPPASVTFVDRLPRNSMGELLRAQLRALVTPPQSQVWTLPEAVVAVP